MGQAGAVIGAIVFIVVGYAVYSELETVTWSHVRGAIEAIGWMDIGIAAFATTVSYIALIGYDLLALAKWDLAKSHFASSHLRPSSLTH